VSVAHFEDLIILPDDPWFQTTNYVNFLREFLFKSVRQILLTLPVVFYMINLLSHQLNLTLQIIIGFVHLFDLDSRPTSLLQKVGREGQALLELLKMLG